MKLRLLLINCFFSAVVSCGYSQTINLTSYPQLNLWLRADTLISLNSDSTINSWTDIANNIVFSPPSGSQAPLIQNDSTQLNNHVFANFDGANDGLISNSAVGLRNYSTTVLLVLKIKNPTFFGHIVCYGANANGTWNLREVNNSGRLSFINANANVGAGVDGSGSNPAGTTTSLSLSPDFAIVSAAVNPSTGQWDLYENFDNKHSANVSFSQGSGNILSIGYRTDAGLFGDFKMAELMIFDSTLSITQTDEIKEYLQERYSGKVNLGPDITISYGFCDTMLSAGSNFSSFIWSDGDTNQSISVNKSGEYYVTATDIFGFKSSDTVNVLFPGNTSIRDTTICLGGSLAWNTELPQNSYSFLWQDNLTTDSLFEISFAGQYYVQITDTLGCLGISDTVSIAIDSFPSIVSLGADTSLCSGNSVYLKTGASLVSSYLWSDSSTNDSLQILASGQYWLTAMNANSCSKKDTINITIAGNAPTADFSNSVINCIGDVSQFTDLSIPPSGDTIVDWYWDFGDANTSTISSPSHTYADTGTYSVSFKVTTNEGCSAGINKIIHVYPLPVATFTETNLCEDAGALFTGAAATFGYPVSAWSWNFADPGSGTSNISSVQNAGHYYTSSGIYPVALIVTNTGGCADTTSHNVTIKPGPVGGFSSTLACRTDLIQFTDNSTLPSGTTLSSTFWNFGDATSNSNVLNPSHSYLNSSMFNVTHVVTVSNGCKDTIVSSIVVNQKPIADFSSADGCVASLINFSDQSTISAGNIAGWAWAFTSSDNSMLQNPQYIFNSAGTYNVRLIINSDQGCKDTVNKSVVIHPLPVSGFTFNPNYGSPPLSVTFTNTSTGASAYVWNFDDGTSTSSLVNPLHNYLDTGIYQISLVAVSSFGCSDTSVSSLQVEPRIMDIEVSDFSTSVQDNFLTVTAQFKNNGTADVHTMDVYFKVNDGASIKENWGGLLLRNAEVLYTFTTSVFIENQNHYVCVAAQKPNGFDDDVPSNNKLCNSIEIGEFQVFSPYPNPVHTIISLPVFIPSLSELNIEIFSGSGQRAENVFFGSVEEGFYTFPYDTQKLTAGLYLLKITYKNEVVIQKFTKN
jgi:PKD repeat protein